MSFKYVPVLKNRQEEMTSLKELYRIPVSSKIMPLIEIVQEKSRENSKKTLFEELTSSIKPNTNYMVDVLRLNKPKKSKKPINKFLINARHNPIIRYNIFRDLKSINGVIPVVSYDPNYFVNGEIINDAKNLRKFYDKLAFRIKAKKFNEALSEVSLCIMDGDILIYDIEHTSTLIIKNNFKSINNVKKVKNIETVIIDSMIPESFTNNSISHGNKIISINTNLRNDYISYGFSAFGNYVNIKSSLPSDGGTISPGFLYYSWNENIFYGFKGRAYDLAEFKDYILPSLLKSTVWSQFSQQHRNECPCCSQIALINNDENITGKSQGLWKRLATTHYIYTMDKHL